MVDSVRYSTPPQGHVAPSAKEYVNFIGKSVAFGLSGVLFYHTQMHFGFASKLAAGSVTVFMAGEWVKSLPTGHSVNMQKNTEEYLVGQVKRIQAEGVKEVGSLVQARMNTELSSVMVDIIASPTMRAQEQQIIEATIQRRKISSNTASKELQEHNSDSRYAELTQLEGTLRRLPEVPDQGEDKHKIQRANLTQRIAQIKAWKEDNYPVYVNNAEETEAGVKAAEDLLKRYKKLVIAAIQQEQESKGSSSSRRGSIVPHRS